jgi:hypothetical protein
MNLDEITASATGIMHHDDPEFLRRVLSDALRDLDPPQTWMMWLIRSETLRCLAELMVRVCDELPPRHRPTVWERPLSNSLWYAEIEWIIRGLPNQPRRHYLTPGEIEQRWDVSATSRNDIRRSLEAGVDMIRGLSEIPIPSSVARDLLGLEAPSE